MSCLSETRPKVAVTVTVPVVAAEPIVIGNDSEACPAAIVTDGGTVTPAGGPWADVRLSATTLPALGA